MKCRSYSATSTNSKPHCENPISIAPKKDVGATFLTAVEIDNLTLCFPVHNL